ncbi:uncharacterized protein LOC132547104 [Ylistrum balloti]|uniref:uncharacterized protein LOC132547104 n=1 Tax=Ylistrum balloti TaxID=509963 RepID=UPI002905DB9D|nr:uncharacterized protein LOC132547104 [Ylistrum balloti]
MVTAVLKTAIILSLVSCCHAAPTVTTKLGEIKGTVENGVYQFRNIPYAKPPIGTLRFSKPEEHGPWDGVLDGTEFGPSCLQECPPEFKRMLPHQRQSEDCLSLNVYTPKDPSAAPEKSVMVWIHGGAYSFGQGMYFDASHLALTGDVIVVTMNYRLGVFGFLTTMDDRLPGNYGLWDQRLALKWVHEHISSFGGNPRSVTLFGESAGGFSVCLHALNPTNRGLFHRIITQSGVPTSVLTLWHTAKSFSLNVGISLGCTNDTLEESNISCIRQISAERLLSVQEELLSVPDPAMRIEIRMGPVVDGVLIPDTPFNLINDISSPSHKFFLSLDYITGTTNQDGSIAAPSLINIANYANFDINNGFPTRVFFGAIFPSLVSAFYGDLVRNTLPKTYVCPLYESSNMTEQASKILDAFTDAVFVVPAITTLNVHADGNDKTSTYQYLFERPHLDPMNHQRLPSWVKGSAHTSELLFLFGNQGLFGKYNITVDPVDLTLSRKMMKYWSNFAKHGNPNSADLPPWKAYNTAEQAYISLDSIITTGNSLYSERLNSRLFQRISNLINGFISLQSNLIFNHYFRESATFLHLSVKMAPFRIGMMMMMTPLLVMGRHNPVVRTNMGQGRGIVENNVNQFRNIPFAKPPLGPLRFAKPVAADHWRGVRDATQFGPSCMQPFYPETDKFLPNLNKSEDCLYLNVYVPGKVVAGSNKPVMVWVHGGAFLVGQAMLYDASFLASSGDVVVVTANYRLGVFGFLSTMDPSLPGNYGLWDQRFALQWVQKNIESFGGNPQSVTLFGASAGGMSVSLQALNPMNKGLFQRVIAQSGVALSAVTIWENAATFARDIGVFLNCSSSTSILDDAYIKCMRSVSSDVLANTQNIVLLAQSMNHGPVLRNNMGPVVDHILIPDSPFKLLTNTSSPSSKFFRSLDFMAGTVNQEGSLFLNRLAHVANSKHFNFKTGVPTGVFCDYLAQIFTATFASVSDRTISLSKVCALYRRSDAVSQANSVLNCFADVNFIVPAIETLNIHSVDNLLTATYQYMFNRPSLDRTSLETLPPWFVGAPHASEIFFLFGAEEFRNKFNITVSEADMALSRKMMIHWTNFAKIGRYTWFVGAYFFGSIIEAKKKCIDTEIVKMIGVPVAW